jgi:hypothetical protein
MSSRERLMIRPLPRKWRSRSLKGSISPIRGLAHREYDEFAHGRRIIRDLATLPLIGSLWFAANCVFH